MSNNKDHFGLGILLGAAAGALLGILYAPKEGKVTRNKLTFKLKKVQEQLETYIQGITDGKIEHVSMAKTKGQQVVNDAKEKAEKLLQDVESLIHQVKD